MKEVYNVYLITGSNDSVISNTVSDILKQVNCDDNNKIIYNLKENTISDVIEEANTVSLFRSNKVILVYSSSIDKLDDEELIMYLNNYNKDVYLIFIVEKSDARKKIVKLINEKGISIDSDNVDKSYNKNYVVSYLKDNGYKMNSNVIECFLSRVSDNIDDIRNISFYCYGNKGKYLHYQDNGIDFNYLNKEYNLYEIEFNEDYNIKLKYKDLQLILEDTFFRRI